MKMRFTFLFSFYFFCSTLWAVAPSGYYNNANGKNTSALRSALQTIITNGHNVTSYSGLWNAYVTTDLNPSTGKIWDMYSNCNFTYSKDECGTYSSECDCYNREHSVPQSWFNESSPMVSDAFHVYPTDGKVNNMRNNYPFGEVGSVTYTSGNGSKVGTSSFSGYSSTVFEPIDEYKGDFARTYFYMATRYASVCENWASGAEVVFGSNNLGFTTYAINLFLKWSRQDPVSAKETARNEAVYSVQNNRNPFIDYPGLEEFIWGNNTSAVFSSSGVSITAPTLTSPSSTNITNSTATLGANITSLGNGSITESGIYYSTTNGFANGTGTKITATSTATGAFTTSVSTLTAATTYYFKGYATNSAGTGYTPQASFVTLLNNEPTISAGTQVNSGSTLNFGAVNGAVTKSLQIKTTTLTGNLTVTVTGSMFSASTTTILKAEAEAGFNLQVTYNPTSIGSHTGTITISGGGIVNSYIANLTGRKL